MSNTMTFATTLTQKGQITIPKYFREVLGLRVGDKIELGLDQKNKKVKLERLPTAEELAGSFKVKNPIDPVKLREYMETHYERF